MLPQSLQPVSDELEPALSQDRLPVPPPDLADPWIMGGAGEDHPGGQLSWTPEWGKSWGTLPKKRLKSQYSS